jgi:hypothetical protein
MKGRCQGSTPGARSVGSVTPVPGYQAGIRNDEGPQTPAVTSRGKLRWSIALGQGLTASQFVYTPLESPGALSFLKK